MTIKTLTRNPVIEEDLSFIVQADIPWENLEGKNILITGANGFLPAYLVETILFLNESRFRKKARILALVRNEKKALERFACYKKRKELRFIIQDVCAPIDIEEEVHFIIHAASKASPKFYMQDPVGTLSANVIGAQNLLEVAKIKNSECFLYISSSEVYGRTLDAYMPIKEDVYGAIDPTLPRSCYAESKRMGEAMSLAWGRQHKVPVKIVRPFHTYGPGLRLDDGRVYADFVSDIIHARDIHIKSDGSAVRSFCYIADMTVGIFTVLVKGNDQEIYNIGNPDESTSVAELANSLVEVFSEKNLKVHKESTKTPGVGISMDVYIPDITKIMGMGWTPQYSLKEGFVRTVRSYDG